MKILIAVALCVARLASLQSAAAAYPLKESQDDQVELLTENDFLWGRELEDDGSLTRPPATPPVAPAIPTVPTVPPLIKNLYPFTTGQLEDVATFPDRLASIVNNLDGNINGVHAQHEDLLNLNECRSLRNYVDSVLEAALQVQKEGEDAQTTTLQDLELHEMEDIKEDIRFTLNPSKLRSFISYDSVENMYNAFSDYASNFPLSRIVLRRTSLSGYEKHIQYHNDGDTPVMRVWLNEDGVDGGNLVYLNKDGATKVISKPGSAVVHGNKLVHGITPMNGTRYILLLLGESREGEDVFEDLLSSDRAVDTTKETRVA